MWVQGDGSLIQTGEYIPEKGESPGVFLRRILTVYHQDYKLLTDLQMFNLYDEAKFEYQMGRAGFCYWWCTTFNSHNFDLAAVSWCDKKYDNSARIAQLGRRKFEKKARAIQKKSYENGILGILSILKPNHNFQRQVTLVRTVRVKRIRNSELESSGDLLPIVKVRMIPNEEELELMFYLPDKIHWITLKTEIGFYWKIRVKIENEILSVS